MTAEDVYRHLVAGSRVHDFDAFDAHVVASIVALAYFEAHHERSSIIEAIGLDRADLSRLLKRVFPHAAASFPADGLAAPARRGDELSLTDLLIRCGTTGSSFEGLLAAMIARRAQRPNHLWQDLGLCNRSELNRLMKTHFAPLATRNSNDMKWKKFLYRMICRDTGYALCTAPSCSECDDFDGCFNEESGESLLARIRRSAKAAA